MSLRLTNPGVQPIAEVIIISIAKHLLVNVRNVGTKISRIPGNRRVLMARETATLRKQLLPSFRISYITFFWLQQLNWLRCPDQHGRDAG